MLNKLQIWDEEPDFTQPVDSKASSKRTVAVTRYSDCDRLPRRYSLDDLISVEKDPICKSNWFLANYWPVYVGNFKVEHHEQETWYEQISSYFAYKGLLTRMIYVHREVNDKEYANYQKVCMLFDMLVYFTSKSDAERAIATCHQDSYYGFKLKVLPGRVPVFFDKTRSVKFIGLTKSCKSMPMDTSMDIVLSRYGKVMFASRYPNDCVVVEFETMYAMINAVSSQFKYKPVQLKSQFMKQRFVENDVMSNIELEYQSNPSFINMHPKASVLFSLFEGVRPNVSTQWMGHKEYVMSKIILQRYRKGKKRIAHLTNKKKKFKTDKIKKEDEAPVPRPKLKTKRQIEQENIKYINGFLRQYHLRPVSRAAIVSKENLRLKTIQTNQ